MSGERLSRFKRQQRATGPRPARFTPKAGASSATASAGAEVLDTLIEDKQAVRSRLGAAPAPGNADAAALLRELRKKWDAERSQASLDELRGGAITAVAVSFGLGSLVAAHDKRGGNVTTHVTAADGAFAENADAYRREDYAGSRYRTARQLQVEKHRDLDTGRIRDVYSGRTMSQAEADCDHVVAARTFHVEGGFMLSREERAAFGADRRNLAPTTSAANRSLGAKDKKEWAQRLASDGSGRTNKEAQGHDNRRVNPAVKRGRAAAQEHLPDTVDQARYYGTRVATTSAGEAVKGGLQQATGALMTEFITAAFDEIADAWNKKGTASNGWLDGLATRFKRIVKRLATRWEAVWAGFKAGALSAFLSNIATTLINMLFTTAKKLVRVIRDGFFAILRAFKIVMNPPPGLDPAEARQAGLNLLATAVVGAIGASAGEVLEKSLEGFCLASVPLLVPLVPGVAGAVTALLTAIASSLVVRTLEGLDLFGANANKTHRQVLAMLDGMIEESDERIGALLKTGERKLARWQALEA